jgi:hypothetical protein
MMNVLADRVFALPDIEERPIDRAGPPNPPERALWLKDNLEVGPSEAFINEREIGHFHPWDRSMHIALPPDVALEAVAAGWAEVHPVALAGAAPMNLVMLYGPRDAHEVEILYHLVLRAYHYAGGKPPQPCPLPGSGSAGLRGPNLSWPT